MEPQRGHSRQVGSRRAQELFSDDPQEKQEEFSLGPSRNPEAIPLWLEATTADHAENYDAKAPVASENQEKEDTDSLDAMWEAESAGGMHSTSSSINTPAAPTETRLPHHIRPRPQEPPQRMHASST